MATMHICASCGLPIQPRTNLGKPLPDNIRAFLSNNDAPRDTDRDILRTTAKDLADGVGELNRHIESLTRILADLKNEKLLAETKLTQVTTILHPIRILPPEVVHEIMLSVLTLALEKIFTSNYWDPTVPNMNSLTSAFPSWTLAQICKSWRDIAIRSPRLWSYIMVDLRCNIYTERPLRAILHKFGLLLDRSKDYDLSVLLVLNNDHPLLGLLESSARRWRSLRIFGSALQLHTFNDVHFPRLKRLHFKDGTARTSDTVAFFPESCPNLEECTLSGPSLPVSVSLPWHVIKHLTLSRTLFSAAKHIPILCRLTSVEELRIFCRSGSVQPDTPHAVLLLPRLRYLEIVERRCEGGISQTLSLFGQQPVANLVLEFPFSRSIQLPHLASHVQPTQLTIECNFFHHEDNSIRLTRFLTSTPSVEALIFKDTGNISGDILRSLTVHHSVSDSDSSILPKLESLSLDPCAVPVFYPDAFLDFAESRLRQNPRFRLLDFKSGLPVALTFNDAERTSRWNTFRARRYGDGMAS